jgi:predicted nicotinamide N-methyase
MVARDDLRDRGRWQRLASIRLMEQAFTSFVVANTRIASAPLVPEIRLHVASDGRSIFEAAEALARAPALRFPPYWAFAWPGGQALARHLLDNRSLLTGRRIVDIGSGSGIGAIAAAMAGAAHVLAIDIDPVAEAAISLNAAVNSCVGRIATTTRDILGEMPDADLVLISDLVYEPELALRVGAFVERVAGDGGEVLLGDRLRARQPTGRLEELARYAAPLFPPLVEDDLEEGRVWRVRACSPRRRAPAAETTR